MVLFTKIMEGVVHEGYLMKSPPEKRILKAKWRRRWFVLRHSGLLPGQFILEYYTDSVCRKSKGKIDLDQCVQVEVAVTFESKKTSYQYMFDIITPKRIYNLVADTEEDMNKWVDCICSVLGLKLYVDEEYITPQEATTNAMVSANPVISTLPSNTVSSHLTVSRSSSNPYIPISECHTGKPILNNNDRIKPNVNDLIMAVPPPSFKERESAEHQISSEFYDYPRPLGPFGNSLCEVLQNDSNYSIPNGSNTLPPRVNWKTYPSESSPTIFSTIPRRDSVDKNDTGAYDVLPSLHSSNRWLEAINQNVEDLNSQFEKTTVLESANQATLSLKKDPKDSEVFVPPPRPPKPPKYRDRHDYENFEPIHLKSKSDAAAYDVPPPTKGPIVMKPPSQSVSNVKQDGGDELSPSTKVPLSSSAGNETLMDDTYDFPKFRSEDNINTTIPHPQGTGTSQRQRRHAYTNAPPGLFNSKGLIFNYEYRPSLMTSDYINIDTSNKEPSPEFSAQPSSCGAYANVPPSPSLINNSLNGTPPAVDRGLKPRRTGDKGALNFLTLQPPPLFRSKASKRSFRKPGEKYLGQAVSSTGFQPGLNGTPPVPNRFRHHHDMSAASEDDLSSSGGSRRNSSNDDQTRYFGYLPSKKDEIQYLDLDLDSEPSPSPKSPERVSATVYKKVDFVKTKAFNETRQNVEESYRKSQ